METITGTVTFMFRDCPKPNGWFGCFFEPDDEYYWSVNVNTRDTITVFGITNISIAKKMRLKITITQNPKDPSAYTANAITVLTDSLSATDAYFNTKDLGDGMVFNHKDIFKLYNRFSSDLFATIVHSPVLLDTMGLNDRQKMLLKNAAGKANPSDMELELKKLIPWASDNLINHIISTYQGNALSEIKQNPYNLFFDTLIRGKYRVKFADVDTLAVKLNIPRNSQLCIHAHLKYTVKNMLENSKDCFIDISDNSCYWYIIDTALNSINSPTVNRNIVGNELKNVEGLIITNTYGRYQLYETATYDAELTCSSVIQKLITEPPVNKHHSEEVISNLISEYEVKKSILLSDEQKAAVITSVNNNISVINGGPGRGKTAIIDCILHVVTRLHKYSVKPILAAPTGRASKRIKESIDKTLERNVNTIAFYMHTESSFLFKNAFVIVDESSMVDIYMASFLLSSLEDSQIVFVGDVHQLPSIDTGSFFSDLCSLTCVPCSTLTKCYRTEAPLIIENADKINGGQLAKALKYDFDTYSLYQQIQDDESFVNDIVATYKDFLHDGYDVKNISVISPINKGLTGVKNLNIKLQDFLNPKTDVRTKQSANGIITVNMRGNEIPCTKYIYDKTTYTRLRIDDKIMYTVNDPTIEGIDPDTGTRIRGLTNGECGILKEYRQDVTDSDNDIIVMKTDDDKEYYIPYDCFNNIILAYAATVHKSQGSEYNAVIVSVPCSICNLPPYMDFASRNLFYTAVTRAKNNVSIFGSINSINRCISTLPRRRQSLLLTRIRDSVLKFRKTVINMPNNYQGHIITNDEKNRLILGETLVFTDCKDVFGNNCSRDVTLTPNMHSDNSFDYSLESTKHKN